MEFQKILLGVSKPSDSDSASSVVGTPLNQGAKKSLRDSKGRFIKTTGKKEYNCLNCNQQVMDYENNRCKFCSRKCYSIYKKSHHISIQNKNKYECEICSTIFFAWGHRKYCSHRCYSNAPKVYEGKKLSEEHKQKISLAKKGIKHSEETKRKMSEVHKGMKHTEESKKKISESKKGKYLGKDSSFYGKKHTLETRKKISLSKLGKKRPPFTEEHRKNIGLGHKGMVFSKESKDKIRNALLGKPRSKETKDKISKSHKGMKHTLETRKKMMERTGDKNPMYGKTPSEKTRQKVSATKQGIPLEEWKKFTSFEPYTYDFNIHFKEKIRERDNYSCQLCNIFEEDHLKLHKKKLSIHHIDYNKLNSFPQNCITLCMRCNILVNKDREIWIKHFQELLKKLYNYEYTQDQKIILDFGGLR